MRTGVQDIISAAVEVRQRGERGLRLPAHVGVAIAEPILVDFHDTVRRHIQVFARICAVGQLIQDEAEHERTVNSCLSKNLQQLTHVRRLFVFIADVVAVQSKRSDGVLVPLDALPATSALVGRAFVGGRTKLGDRDRLALRDKRADAGGVPVGDLLALPAVPKLELKQVGVEY